MGQNTSIEWTGSTWHEKTAAARLNITHGEYVSRRAMGQKWCTKCKAWHHVSFFAIDRSRGDGLKSSCRNNTVRPLTPEARRARINAASRKWYAGPAGVSVRIRKSARKRGVRPLPVEGRDTLMQIFAGECAYCDRPATTFDHIIPVSKGGNTTRGNVVPACNSCNSRKRARPLEDFLKIAPNPKTGLIVDELVMEYLV